MREAVQTLVQRLVETGSVTHTEPLARLTGEERTREIIHVGDRVVLPHLRTDAVAELVVALGVTPTPLSGPSAAAQSRTQVVVLVLAPPQSADLYLQMVASLARTLRQDGFVDRLVAARSPEEVLALPEFRALELQPRLTVRDVMTQRVYRVTPDTPVRELLQLMNQQGLNAVPVVGEKREVLGMVTDRDLLRHFLPTLPRAGGRERAEAHTDHTIGDLPVREIMSRSVMCIPEEQALTEVASIMVNKDVERLPVVSEGKLTGFLTRSDIIRKLFST